jgi:hypothetical protein
MTTSYSLPPIPPPGSNDFVERRKSPRHVLRDARGTLSWDEQAQRITCEIDVVDMSGSGVAALAHQVPPADLPVWISLESSVISGPLEGRLVIASADPSGKHLVRMRFTSWLSIGEILEPFEEHRQWKRYPAREKSATLNWLDTDQEIVVPVELQNISGGGAAVVTDATLPGDQSIRLIVEVGKESTTPVESRLVGSYLDASGLNIARLKFVEDCPLDLFESVVNGPC